MARLAVRSALYTGTLRHRRFLPRAHEFSYRLFMVSLDLDEIDAVMALSPWWSAERFNLGSFRRRDYLDGEAAQAPPLKQAVLDRVEAACGERPNGPVQLLAHCRYFGYVFNPVAFYYCHHDGDLHSIVADITNTPWKERHAYVLPVAGAEARGSAHGWRFRKRFHVSPFVDMDRGYDWRFTAPGERLAVHMVVERDTETEFDATLGLQREPVTRRNLRRVLAHYPLMCTRVILAIHMQAFRLWMKRVPVFVHPKKRASTS